MYLEVWAYIVNLYEYERKKEIFIIVSCMQLCPAHMNLQDTRNSYKPDPECHEYIFKLQKSRK